MKKIELTCPECKSTMRLDAVNVGKQARCPVCKTITQIPLDAAIIDVETSDEPNSEYAKSNSQENPKAKKKKSVSRDSVFNEPQPTFGNSPRPNSNAIGRNTILGLDKLILYSFLLGIASIASNFMCCGPYVGLPAALIGIVFVFMSNSRLKQSGFVINIIGLVISSGFLIFRSWLF